MPGGTGAVLSRMVADYVGFKKAGGKWTPKTTSQLANLFRVQVDQQLLEHVTVRSTGNL
jgi:hypothetical protein